MTRVVISFLGSKSPKAEPYDYSFPGSTEAISKRYFLPALLEWLDDQNTSADEVVVMGVATSAWADLTRELAQNGSAKEQALGTLSETGPNAEPSQDVLTAAWQGLTWRHASKVEAVLLKDLEGNWEEESNRKIFVETLQQLQKALRIGERIVLDLSQGIRHQPLIALLAAIYLRNLPQHRPAKPAMGEAGDEQPDRIEHIFSASALRDDKGQEKHEVAVRDLRYLLVLADWIFALGAFEASGNVGVLEKVLRADGNSTDAVTALVAGGSLERATRFRPAAGKLREALAALDFTEARDLELKGAGELFAGELDSALEWVRAEATPSVSPSDPELARRARDAAGQAALGRWYLQRGDFVRATIYLFEAAIDQLIAKGDIKPDSSKDREIKNKVNTYIDGRCPLYMPLFALRTLRNLVAHGTDFSEVAGAHDPGWKKEAHLKLEELLSEPENLTAKLEAIADTIFGPRNDRPRPLAR